MVTLQLFVKFIYFNQSSDLKNSSADSLICFEHYSRLIYRSSKKCSSLIDLSTVPILVVLFRFALTKDSYCFTEGYNKYLAAVSTELS